MKVTSLSMVSIVESTLYILLSLTSNTHRLSGFGSLSVQDYMCFFLMSVCSFPPQPAGGTGVSQKPAR